MVIAKVMTGNCRASQPVVYAGLSGGAQSYLGFIIFFIINFKDVNLITNIVYVYLMKRKTFMKY